MNLPTKFYQKIRTESMLGMKWVNSLKLFRKFFFICEYKCFSYLVQWNTVITNTGYNELLFITNDFSGPNALATILILLWL